MTQAMTDDLVEFVKSLRRTMRLNELAGQLFYVCQMAEPIISKAAGQMEQCDEKDTAEQCSRMMRELIFRTTGV